MSFYDQMIYKRLYYIYQLIAGFFWPAFGIDPNKTVNRPLSNKNMYSLMYGMQVGSWKIVIISQK